MARVKTGGRQKGALNKKTVVLEEICERKGVVPFEALIEMMFHEDDDLRFQAIKEACRYLYPQRKAIEHSNPEGEGFKIVLEDYSKPK